MVQFTLFAVVNDCASHLARDEVTSLCDSNAIALVYHIFVALQSSIGDVSGYYV